MKDGFCYYIKYKLYWDSEYSEFKFNGEYLSLKDTIYQLWRWLARLNEKLIKWLHVIEDIQISEQNYDFESNWKHYENDDAWEQEQFGNEYFNDSPNTPLCLEDDLRIWVYFKDITNQLFRECNISIESLSDQKWIHLEKDYLYANWVPFPTEKGTKVYELLDIILRLRYFHNNKVITYEMIKNFYMNNIFDELKISDIKQSRIRDILKSKMEDIRDSLWLKGLPISAQKGGIMFRI